MNTRGRQVVGFLGFLAYLPLTAACWFLTAQLASHAEAEMIIPILICSAIAIVTTLRALAAFRYFLNPVRLKSEDRQPRGFEVTIAAPVLPSTEDRR